jgi:transcriptional regulator with XRE-family HTH domain
MACFKERITILYDEIKNSDYKLSQTQIADRFGASRGQLQGWMSGAGEPDSEMMKNVANISKVSVDWLVGATDLRKPYIVEKDSKEYQAIINKIQNDKGLNEHIMNVNDIKTVKFKDKTIIDSKTLFDLVILTEKIKKELAGD